MGDSSDAPLRVQGRIDCVLTDARCNRCNGEHIRNIFARPLQLKEMGRGLG